MCKGHPAPGAPQAVMETGSPSPSSSVGLGGWEENEHHPTPCQRHATTAAEIAATGFTPRAHAVFAGTGFTLPYAIYI